ncbi:hypothetical protein MWN52_13590 [Pseudoxanthomonas winnipegensis]|nr:hypothetical protein [Pseudoxanthomonas winnipegensis]WJI14653.1 hypothetical protein MWN52_13590 [Pseudoxanthomonas winnipegensis]
MSTCRFLLICSLLVGLASCSGGGPSSDQRQRAFVTYMKEEGSDNAKVRDFESGKCVKSQSAPTYACHVSARVEAAGRDLGHELDGIYTFAELGSDWKVTGRIQ